jgi:hypothetical protein
LIFSHPDSWPPESAFAVLAESKIRAAIANGEFAGLPGRGKPLARDALARVPAELRMGYRILRNAGCLPPELEARKEVARLGALLDATGDAEERAHLSRLRREAELRYALITERRPR